MNGLTKGDRNELKRLDKAIEDLFIVYDTLLVKEIALIFQ